MSNRTKLILSTVAGLFPLAAFADGIDKTIAKVGVITTFVGGTLPRLFFALALAYFFYGLGSYVMGVDDKKKAEAKTTMIFGIIVLFVMSSVFGLIRILQDATDTGGSQGVNIPTIQ